MLDRRPRLTGVTRYAKAVGFTRALTGTLSPRPPTAPQLHAPKGGAMQAFLGVVSLSAQLT